MLELEGKDKGEWGFKALKQMIKINFKLVSDTYIRAVCQDVCLILNIPVNIFFNYVGMGLPGLKPVLNKDLCILLKDTRQ